MSAKSERNWNAGIAAGNALVGGAVGANTLRNVRTSSRLSTAVGATWAGLSGGLALKSLSDARKAHLRAKKSAFGVVSKIAMQPVFHGTSAAGATKLVRHISSKTPETSAFKFATGTDRPGTRTLRRVIEGDNRPKGLYTTPDKTMASEYSVMGRSPQHAGLGFNRRKGRVLTFNAVGVKPKYRDAGKAESVYDPRELGAPVKMEHVKRSRVPTISAAAKKQAPKDYQIKRNRKKAFDPNYQDPAPEFI